MKMNNILLERLSKKTGVQLKVRDKEKWMDESLEKQAEYLARKEMAARKASKVFNETNEQEAIDKFYAKGNKVD